MQIPTLKASIFGSWIMALVYDWIEKTSGLEFRILLYLAIILLIVGIYTCNRKHNKTTGEEV